MIVGFKKTSRGIDFAGLAMGNCLEPGDGRAAVTVQQSAIEIATAR
jgi:hypothetical protein